MHEIEPKCKCHCHIQNAAHMMTCNRGKCNHCDPIVTPNPKPPENDGEKGEGIVTGLDEDRKLLEDFRDMTGEFYLSRDKRLIHTRFIEELLAAKERVVRSECAEGWDCCINPEGYCSSSKCRRLYKIKASQNNLYNIKNNTAINPPPK